ncbi:MAG: WD40 repeat domain-containing protein, partial [Acidobacteriota bacterium]
DPETKAFRRFRSSVGLRYSATSHDGTLLAEADTWNAPAIKITDIWSGRSWRLGAHPNVVGSLAYNPEGNILAAGGGDGTIYLFDASTRQLIRALAGDSNPVAMICFSPDGKRLISCDNDNRLKLWDLASGRTLAENVAGASSFGSRTVRRLDWSTDGETILTVREDEVRLWKTEDLKSVRTLKVKEKYEYRSSQKGLGMIVRSDTVPVIDAVFGGYGKKIVAEYADGTLRTWDIRSGKQIRRARLGGSLGPFLFSSDGITILASTREAGRSRLKILDAESGKERASFDPERLGIIHDFVISPDGKHAAGALGEPLVLVWAIGDPKPLHVVEMGAHGFSALAFSPDGKTLAAGGENQNLMLFDVASGARLWQLIPDYQPGELETRLSLERKEHRAAMDELRARRDERAAAETPVFEKQVYITVEHYGVRRNPGSLRFSETGEPDKSRLRTSAKEAEAIWLRLHNDSSLPIKLLASAPYLDAMTCEYKFAEGNIIRGLFPDREIGLRLDFADKDGNAVPPFYDNSFVIKLLPKTSLLFAVYIQQLREGRRFKLRYSFQNAVEKDSSWALIGLYTDYGTEKALKFSLADIPNPYGCSERWGQTCPISHVRSCLKTAIPM